MRGVHSPGIQAVQVVQAEILAYPVVTHSH